jgi:pimeloyl-ACP methyl ester carboxylesterase
MKDHPTDIEPINLADHSAFYIGMRYTEVDGRTTANGGMYVERVAPLEQTAATPVVMIHGYGQTGTNFTATPDGRRGWLHDFLRAGYVVYIVDQPERGRSGNSLQQINGGGLFREDVTKVENYFTAPAHKQLWPQAQHHTQWPGTGQSGDAVFDQFYASQAQGLADRTESELLCTNAFTQLLEKIGPAILLCHSQAGSFGWLIADAMPTHVKAILSIEPNGPPFFDVKYSGINDTGEKSWYGYNADRVDRPYGITRAPLTFDPPLKPNEALTFERQHEIQAETNGQNLVAGYLQTHPARQLTQLQGIPIMILVAQASYHRPYDHLTSEFLKQAGVDNELVYLEDHGLTGNGHMVMLEKNNHQVAEFLINWLKQRELA